MGIFQIDPGAFRRETDRITKEIREQMPRRPGGPVQQGRVIVLPAGGRILPVHTPPAFGCTHRQAEPVILSSGETVACVCVECFEALSPDWIERQRQQAELAARCTHDDLIDITSFGQIPGTDTICSACGARNP